MFIICIYNLDKIFHRLMLNSHILMFLTCLLNVHCIHIICTLYARYMWIFYALIALQIALHWLISMCQHCFVYAYWLFLLDISEYLLGGKSCAHYHVYMTTWLRHCLLEKTLYILILHTAYDGS